MRITIEMTEAESQSTTILPEGGGAVTARQGAPEAPASDGGSPPEALLLALGGRTQAGAQGSTDRGATDGGGPPTWLVDVITGGGERGSA